MSKNDNCPHGTPKNPPCGLCMTDEAPKCGHGNAFYCGLCLAETGDGRVPPLRPKT
jgi:hypothetical protein